MRNKAISTMCALPCLVSAAALYSANKLRKQNKALKRAAAIHQSQMEAYARCLAEVDLRNGRLAARLESCRQGRAREEKEHRATKEALADCKEQLEHLECHHKELKADAQAVRRERDAVKIELGQVRAAAQDIIDETMRELELVYEWIRACGYAESELQNALQQEFYGNVPSELYRRKKNEQKMQEALAAEQRDGETE